MAEKKSTQYALAYDTANGFVGAGEAGGKLKVNFDSFTPSATLDLADTILLQKLPAGARVLDVVLSSEAQSNSCTLDVGYQASEDMDGDTITADPNGFIDALACNGAATGRMTDEANFAGQNLKFGIETQPQITVSVAGTATTSVVECAVYYLVD